MKEVILFIDIETVPQQANFSLLPPKMQALWVKKSIAFDTALTSEELYDQKAGIYAEFGKIITIAVGLYFRNQDNNKALRVRSFSSDNEKEILEQFSELLSSKFSQQKVIFCAHNGKEFDYPYISRRMLINGLKLPECLQIAGKKPWEISHVDTLEMWKFGDHKNYTSLETLTTIFEIESSKNDIDGSKVRDVYYLDRDLKRIAEYCQDDVVATAQVYLKLKGEPIIDQQLVFKV